MKKIFVLTAAALVLAACCSQPKFDGPVYNVDYKIVEDEEVQ